MKSIIKNEFENIDNLLKQITIKDYPFDNEKTLSLLENSENLTEVDAINNTENISKLPEKIIPSHFAPNSNWLGNVMISIMQYKVIIMNLFILTSLVGLVSLFYNSASDENTILTNKSDTTQTTLTISGFSVSDTLNNVILTNKSTDSLSNSQNSGIVILSGQVEKGSSKSVTKTLIYKIDEDLELVEFEVDGKNDNDKEFEMIIHDDKVDEKINKTIFKKFLKEPSNKNDTNNSIKKLILTDEKTIEIKMGKNDSTIKIIDNGNTTLHNLKTDNNSKKSSFMPVLDKFIDTSTGQKYLELTKVEFNVIVPNSFDRDTLFKIQYEILIETKNDFMKFRMDTLGYDIEKLPLILNRVEYCQPHKNYNWGNEKPITPNLKEYDKCKYISFIDLYKNNVRSWKEATTINAKYSENKKIQRYYELNSNYSQRIYEIKYSNNPKEREKLDIEIKELENLFYEDVIPVKVNFTDEKSFMFFFKPTEEFIAKLPERYRESIKNEVAAKRLLEQNQPFSCETKNFTTDIFALCNDTETIQNARLFPNPGGSELNLSLKVLQDRKTKIELCDFSGNLLKELMSIDFVVGEKVVNIDIDKIPMGLYFIRLSTDKGEVINLRYIKDK